MTEVRAGKCFRVSHNLKDWDNAGDRIEGLDFMGHQRRKSMVCDRTACLSIFIQSGFSSLKYTIESWASLAAW